MLLRCRGRVNLSPNVPERLLPFGGGGAKHLHVPRVELAHVRPQAEVVGPHEGAVGALFLLSAQLVEGMIVSTCRNIRGFPLLVVIRVGYHFRATVYFYCLGEQRPLWTHFEVVLEVLHGPGHVEAGRAHHVAAAPLHLGAISLVTRVLS